MHSRWQALLGWIVLSVGLFFVWETKALYPFRMLAVFFHEISHGLAAILTGGSVETLALDPMEGGHAITRGGWSIIILSAGYLGNLAWGGLLILLSSRMRNDRVVSIILGVILLLATVVTVRGLFGFTFGAASGVALIALGWKGPGLLNDLMLRFIGAFSCLYAIFDIKSDVLDRSELRSDARMLSEVTMVPTLVWGWVWILLSIGLFLWFIWLSSKPRETSLSSSVPLSVG
jgi:hypothetical protein